MSWCLLLGSVAGGVAHHAAARFLSFGARLTIISQVGAAASAQMQTDRPRRELLLRLLLRGNPSTMYGLPSELSGSCTRRRSGIARRRGAAGELATNVNAGGLGDRQQLALRVVLHESSFLLQPSVYRLIGQEKEHLLLVQAFVRSHLHAEQGEGLLSKLL